jgi:hypothetical protein
MHARHSEADMQVGHQNIQDGDQFELNYRRGHSSWKVCLGGVQLARDESLVPKRSPLRENSSGISKGIFQMDISGFESYMPSQAVRSLRSTSDPARNIAIFPLVSTTARGLWDAIFRTLDRYRLFSRTGLWSPFRISVPST